MREHRDVMMEQSPKTVCIRDWGGPTAWSAFRRSLPIAAWSVVMIAVIAGAGCSSDEEAASTAPSPKPAATVNRPVEQAAPAQAAPDEPSAELQAAATAFRTMTAENVSPAEWEAANQKLQDIGQPALPVLIKGLKSDDQVKREMASTVLAWFGIEAEPAAESLIAALDDDSTFVRANVATALLQIPDHVDRVVPVLSQFLASDDTDLKRMAATNLAAVDAEKARPLLPQLIAALDDDDREVVYYSTQLLGRIGPDAAQALPKLKAIEPVDDEALQSAIDTAILRIEPEDEASGEAVPVR